MSEISTNTVLLIAELMLLMMLFQIMVMFFLVKVVRKVYLKMASLSSHDAAQLLLETQRTLVTLNEEEIKYNVLHKQYYEEKASHYEREAGRLAGESGKDYRKFKYYTEWEADRQRQIDKCFSELFDHAGS